MHLNHLSAAALLGIAGLHVGWAAGAAWPFADRAALAGHGTGRQDVPGPRPCLAVAGLLGTAAVLVAGRPRRFERFQRAGARTVASVLFARAAFGVAGRTDLLAPGSSSPDFRVRDRRLYSPLCFALATAALP